MENMIAADGTVVTEEMITRWTEALDRDEWPEGWENKSEIMEGKPVSYTQLDTLSIKLPTALKTAAQKQASNEGKTVSAYVRGLIASALLTL